LEQHAQGHADGEALDRAIDDVGGQPEARLLLQLDEADHVRHFLTGKPALVIDRVAVQARAPAHPRGGEVAPATARADRARRVDEPGARHTARELEAAGAAGTPERLRVRLEGRGRTWKEAHTESGRVAARRDGGVMPPSGRTRGRTWRQRRNRSRSG